MTTQYLQCKFVLRRKQLRLHWREDWELVRACGDSFDLNPLMLLLCLFRGVRLRHVRERGLLRPTNNDCVQERALSVRNWIVHAACPLPICFCNGA